MPAQRFHLKPHRVGGMQDRIDPVLEVGMREIRNIQRNVGRWDHRYGWAKTNAEAMPWKVAIGATSFRDTQDTLHIVVVGGDGNLYASVDSGASFQVVTLHATVYWDESYRATFAKHGDDLFIALGAVTGDSVNLRYNGITAQAFGVSLAAPATAPTLAEDAMGAGDIDDGIFDYFVAFYDATTGREGDASPVAQITMTRPEPPEAPPTLAEGVAGNVALGIPHRYIYTFYQPATGIESERCANFRSITPVANAQIELTDVRACPDAGVWQRRIYRDDNGAGYMLLATIADNITTVYSDNIAAPAGAEYEYQTRAVNLMAIATYAGTGRTIHRRIYRQDDGAGYRLLATIADNTTVAYTDTLDVAPGAGWVQRLRIPVCAGVAINRDGTAVWLNDVENGEPARLYVAAIDDPESRSTETLIAIQSVGTADDPLVGGIPVRDGIAAYKRHSVYWIPRYCKKCESMIEGVGAVAWSTIRNIGSQIAALGDMGPWVVSHEFEEDWRFVGPTPRRFCLAAFWETVLEDRLPWATCTHHRKWGIIEWHVQRCEHGADYVSKYGNHNDTSIVWDYGCRSSQSPGGEVWIADRMIDQGFEVPGTGLTSDAPWGAFPLGYVGPLYDGPHGDGVDELIRVQVLSANGVYITIGDTNLLTGEPLSLDDEGWRGSVFYVVKGSGNHVCQKDILPCWRPSALIIDHSLASGVAGRLLQTAEALGVDATSKAWIGGYAYRGWIDGIDADDPDSIKTMPHCDIQIKGTT